MRLSGLPWASRGPGVSEQPRAAEGPGRLHLAALGWACKPDAPAAGPEAAAVPAPAPGAPQDPAPPRPALPAAPPGARPEHREALARRALPSERQLPLVSGPGRSGSPGCGGDRAGGDDRAGTRAVAPPPAAANGARDLGQGASSPRVAVSLAVEWGDDDVYFGGAAGCAAQGAGSPRTHRPGLSLTSASSGGLASLRGGSGVPTTGRTHRLPRAPRLRACPGRLAVAPPAVSPERGPGRGT